jgi:hypothetical protein
MSKDLRKQLIRLAHENPELRSDLLPLLKEGGRRDLPYTEGLRKPWYAFSDGTVALDEIEEILSDDRAALTKIRMIRTLRKKLLEHLNSNYNWD